MRNHMQIEKYKIKVHDIRSVNFLNICVYPRKISKKIIVWNTMHEGLVNIVDMSVYQLQYIVLLNICLRKCFSAWLIKR